MRDKGIFRYAMMFAAMMFMIGLAACALETKPTVSDVEDQIASSPVRLSGASAMSLEASQQALAALTGATAQPDVVCEPSGGVDPGPHCCHIDGPCACCCSLLLGCVCGCSGTGPGGGTVLNPP